MTKKAGMLAVIAFLFLYTAWDFYAGALRYDPLAGVSVGKAKAHFSQTSIPKHEPAWDKEIYEKNVFSPARGYVPPPKPVVRQAAPPPPPPPKKPEMNLQGIVLDPHGEWIAYLSIDGASAVPLRKGDEAEGIEVVDINEMSVMLQWNGEKITLSLNRIKTITNPRMAR
jgi:hypothetical protein